MSHKKIHEILALLPRPIETAGDVAAWRGAWNEILSSVYPVSHEVTRDTLCFTAGIQTGVILFLLGELEKRVGNRSVAKEIEEGLLTAFRSGRG